MNALAGASTATADCADNVTPRCAHFGVCGGCSMQQLGAAAQLRGKQQRLREVLEQRAQTTPSRWLAPIEGPAWGYRRRARLGVKYVHRKQRVLVGFRECRARLIADLKRCEVLSAPVDGLIEALAGLIQQLSIRERLPQIEVAVGDEVTALVLRVLDAPSVTDEALLREFETCHGVRLYLQSGDLSSVRSLSEPPPRLFYRLPPWQLEIDFLPTDFIQVNGEVNRALVAQALELLQPQAGSSVLDLYCGLGNFSLALARRANRVIGIEGDPGLVERARGNARRNGLDNVEFVCADLSIAAGAPVWPQHRYSHVLLDPPRVGAPALLARIAALQPQRLLYVACEPESLARDVGVLVREHRFTLLAAGVVDMFPHTAHVESMALLAPQDGVVGH
ncbi:MAG TPA: 23S rRNA (uracil(1939)-C(5))-methyltransferase RlmD [Steroidobacteraceae bacterium]